MQYAANKRLRRCRRLGFGTVEWEEYLEERMKKVIACLLIGIFLACSAGTSVAAAKERGGVLGFFIGCCFGIRSGVAYNEGKDLHFREWGLVIPIAGFVISIWNGLDCSKGITSKELATQYGATYY